RGGGGRQAPSTPPGPSASMPGPRSAPAGVRRYQTSRRPGSRSAATIPASSSSRKRWLRVFGVIPPRRPIRTRSALLAGGAAVVLGGWFTASAVIAGHGWYHARLGDGGPWLPVAFVGFLGLLLALRRIPVVARALAAPGTVSRLELPHSFRVAEGTAFLLIMALGHLPALFALPAGLGDIAAGIAAPLVALRLAQGTGHRAALWFNAFGM